MIHIDNLSYRFSGSENDALMNLSLDITAGEFIVITGRSGCGKTTLALAIGGYLFRQYEGEVKGHVIISGMDIQEHPIYDIADIVGLVQQNPENQFCTLNVVDEIAFGLENRCWERGDIQKNIEWALEIAGIRHLMGRDLATLSGGEKQKVAIAAMMASKPQVIIFDEPTSNLDPTATQEIFDVIQHIKYTENITVIVIEHKLDYLRRFQPRCIEMAKGEIIYDGRLQEYLASHRETQPIPQTDTLPYVLTKGITPLASVKNLHVHYGDNIVLRHCTLDIHAGEFVSVMGDNGSGKTTLLHCLMGLQKPTQGSVLVLGEDTRDKAVSALARHVGFVFQNPDHQLFTGSVWEEATFAAENFGVLTKTTEKLIRSLLDQWGLGGRLRDHPYRLSYGEKRRLNLISVLSYSPAFLLLDEILIGQDAYHAFFLLNLLQTYVSQGGTVMLVNHAPSLTRRYTDRLLFLDHGEIIVDAPPDHAFAQLNLLEKKAYVV